MLLAVKSWRIMSPWSRATLPADFSSFDAAYQLNGEVISKSSQSEIFSYVHDGKTFFVKRYFRTKGLVSWLGLSRFDLESKNQRWFNQMGVSAAHVVAIGKQSLFLKTFKGVLITEGVVDARELSDIAKHTPELFQRKVWADAVIDKLAEVVAKLHKARFCHNDLHWRNILIQQKSEQDTPHVFLIDCPSGKKLIWPLLSYRKLKDLANLDKLAPNFLSKTQRLRFFLAYQGYRKLTAADKQMISSVMQHKRNRIKRKSKA